MLFVVSTLVIFGAIPAFRSLDRGTEEGRDRETMRRVAVPSAERGTPISAAAPRGRRMPE